SEDERGEKRLDDVPERAQNRLFVLSHEIAPHEHRGEIAIAPQVSEVQIEPPGLRPDDQVPLFRIRLIYKGRAQALLSFADLKSIAAVQGPMSSDICVVNKPRHGSELHIREKWAHHIPPQRDFANYLRENSGVKEYQRSEGSSQWSEYRGNYANRISKGLRCL